MSFPTKDAVFGKIVYKNREYYILNRPFTEEELKKINIYLKENNCGYSSANWKSYMFKWIIEDKKLYLVSIKLETCQNKENLINKIFNTNKLFISFNGDTKVVESKRIIKRVRNDIVMKERKIFTLNFQKGVLNSESEIVREEYLALNFDFEEK
jgi:hypothetical protein